MTPQETRSALDKAVAKQARGEKLKPETWWEPHAIIKWYELEIEWWKIEVQNATDRVRIEEMKKYAERLDKVSSEYAQQRESFQWVWWLLWGLVVGSIGVALVILLASNKGL